MCKKNYFSILFCLLLSACIPVKESHEATITHIVQQNSTDSTIVPLPPIKSTETQRSLPTLLSTTLPTQTKTYPNQILVTETAMPPGMELINGFILHGASPDGAWYWGNDQTGYKDEVTGLTYSKTVIVSRDGKTIWTVRPHTKDVGFVAMQYIYYQPIYWLPNEPYVFLGGDFCCWEGPYGHNAMNLARLDLRSGKFSIQISGWTPHLFAFSQDGKFILDTQNGFPRLRFIRLFDWKIIDISINPKYVHNEIAAFSPDQNRAIIEACQERSENDRGCYRYSLLLVSIIDEKYSVLLSDMVQEMGINIDDFFNRGYQFEYSWSTNNEFRIDLMAKSRVLQSFLLDVNPNQVIEITE